MRWLAVGIIITVLVVSAFLVGANPHRQQHQSHRHTAHDEYLLPTHYLLGQ